jgi:ATP-dependent helicase/nuclease subunit A
VLQHWDFAQPPDRLQKRISALCETDLPSELIQDRPAIEADLHALLASFAQSEAYRMFRRAEILGREVPFVISWEGDRPWAIGNGSGKIQADSSPSPIAHRPLSASCVMEGVIDVIYRLDGQIHLADYKTDRVQDSELSGRAVAYEGQARIYRAAVSRCLGLDQVGVQLVFLRNGKSVSF